MSTGPQHREYLELGRSEDPALYGVRLYIQFLQNLFKQLPAGTFHWEPDLETTEIVIRAEAPLSLDVVGKRPAITVVLGPIQYQGIGIDGLLGYDLATGRKTRTDLLSSTFIVYCLADSDIIASKLGHIVTHYTRLKQRLLESPGGFHQIARPAPSINTPSPPGQLVMGDPTGLVMVQCNIPFQIQWTWSTTPLQNPTDTSLDQITDPNYTYTSLSTYTHARLAMSLSPVKVRKIKGLNPINGLLYSQRPETKDVTSSVDDFQSSGLEDFQTD